MVSVRKCLIFIIKNIFEKKYKWKYHYKHIRNQINVHAKGILMPNKVILTANLRKINVDVIDLIQIRIILPLY